MPERPEIKRKKPQEEKPHEEIVYSTAISPKIEATNRPWQVGDEIPVPGPDATPEELGIYCDRLEAQADYQDQISGRNKRTYKAIKEDLAKQGMEIYIPELED